MHDRLLIPGQTLSDARRPPATSDAHDDHTARRGNAWSYYVFRQDLRMLQRRGPGQRISIDGIPDAVVLEP